MRLDQSKKNRIRLAGLVCLTSVGCVHQQHQSAEKHQFASAQSSLLVKASGQTSNTGRVAVVNDPNQWPEKPSEDHVKSRFTQLFPNLAQREDRPLKVQIGQPETINAQNNDPAEQPEKSISANTDKLVEVTEVTIAKDDVAKVSVDKAEPAIDKSTWATLSQNSAGAISAVAALAASANPDQPQQTPVSRIAEVKREAEVKLKEAEPKPQIVSEIPQVKPAKPSTDPVVVNDSAETIKKNHEQVDKGSAPPPILVPSTPSPSQPVQVPVENLARPPVVNPVKPAVVEPVKAEPEPKPDVSQLPVLKEVAPVPTPLPAVPEVPVIPTVTAIPKPVQIEPKVPVQEPAPAAPAEELVAKVEKPVNPGRAKTLKEATIKELENAPLIVPEAPRVALEIPALPPLIVEKPEAPTPLPLIAGSPVERVALADPKPILDGSTTEPMPQIVPIQPPVVINVVEPQLENGPKTDLKSSIKETLEEPAKPAGEVSAEPPPPTPAPELQIPGLPDVPSNPVTAPESSPVLNSTSDKGVERSSAPVAEPANLVDAKPVDIKASVSEAVGPNEPVEPAAAPAITEEAVPVLKPLLEEPGVGQDESVMVPQSGVKNWSGVIGDRVNSLNPFRRRSLVAENEGQTNQDSGLKSLRSAAGGLFDWRLKGASKSVVSEGASGRTLAGPVPVAESHSEVVQVQPVNDNLGRRSQSNPVPNSSRIASLPPIQFPASYTAVRSQTANPWASHKVPAIELVGRPVESPKVAISSVSEQLKPRPDLGVVKPPPLRDLTVQQTSMTAARLASESKTAVPSESQVKATESPSTRGWWSRAGKGLRSIWTEQDEVVPPKRQTWAGGEMSLTR
jgi:hypothetical protein